MGVLVFANLVFNFPQISVVHPPISVQVSMPFLYLCISIFAC